jgi:ATP phosphoribosyltransferase regulatory subunit
MLSSRTEIPKGVRVYLPPQAALKREIEAKLLSVFQRWGFQEIVTPTFEYYDVLALGLGEAFRDWTFKLTEQATGRVLVLRPDITPQIARVAATILKDYPKPLRFCYSSNVFRYIEPQMGRHREVYQAGVELIGLDLPEADVEMIAIAVESLMEVGLADFKIAVSQVEFLRGLIEQLRLPAAAEKQVQLALHKKDGSALDRLMEAYRLEPRARDMLLALPNLFGGEEVLRQAAAVVNNPRSERALHNLHTVYDMLKVYGLAAFVLLDLSEIRGFDYYTGIVFEGFTANLGYEICSGGRYDHMIGRFGEECPSTGFAIDIEKLQLALERQGTLRPRPQVDFLIIDFKPDKREALRIAKELRRRGYRVARDIIRRDLAGSLAYAQRMGIARGIVLGARGLQPHEALLKDLQQGWERVVPVGQLVQAIEALGAPPSLGESPPSAPDGAAADL